MHDPPSELRRIRIPRTWVNKALGIEHSSPIQHRILCWNTGGDTASYGTWEEARMKRVRRRERTKSKEEAFFSKYQVLKVYKYQVLKVVLSVVLVMFAVTRFSNYESLSTRMDLVFLSLVLSAFLLWMLPWADLWERLSGVTLGGFGISLDAP